MLLLFFVFFSFFLSLSQDILICKNNKNIHRWRWIKCRYQFFVSKSFALGGHFKRALLDINRLDDLIKTALDFSSWTIPREITFHVVWGLGFCCAEKVASLAHVFPYSRNTAFVYFANFLFISIRVCHPLLSGNLMLILWNDKSNYNLIVVCVLVFGVCFV